MLSANKLFEWVNDSSESNENNGNACGIKWMCVTDLKQNEISWAHHSQFYKPINTIIHFSLIILIQRWVHLISLLQALVDV